MKDSKFYDLLESNGVPRDSITNSETKNEIIEGEKNQEYEIDGKTNIFFVQTKQFGKIVVKKIDSDKFRIEEIKALYRLTRDKPENCLSCDKRICENVVKFHGYYIKKGYIYIIQEQAIGNFHEYRYTENIETLSKQDRISEPEFRTKLFFDVAKGLKCAHINFISHFDLSTSNILIVVRNGVKIGCIADFGESEIRTEKDSIPFLPFRFKPHENPNAVPTFSAPERYKILRKNFDFGLEPYPCDIYSLGIIYINFVLKIETNLDLDETRERVKQARKQNQITFMQEEFALSMTDYSSTKRPDIIGVCNEPISWDDEKIIDFLWRVHKFYIRHQTDSEKIKKIEDKIKSKIFPMKNEWTDLISRTDIKIEIANFNKSYPNYMIVPSPLISMITVILIMYEPNKFDKSPDAINKKFLKSRKIVYDEDKKSYIEKWRENLDKFDEIVSLLYHLLQDEIKFFLPDFYGKSTPIRNYVKNKKGRFAMLFKFFSDRSDFINRSDRNF